MKRWVSSLLILMVILTSTNLTQEVSAAPASASLKADGKVVGSIPAPLQSNGTLMFPLVEIFKALGFDASVVNENGSTIAKINYMNAIYGAEVGSTSFKVYDPTGTEHFRTLTSSKAAVLTSNKTVGVPLSYIKEQFGLDVSWNETCNTLVVNNKASKHYYMNNEDVAHGVYLKVNNTQMTMANYIAYYELDIDGSGKTAPIVENGTTLLPVSSMIKELGGTVTWNAKEKKVTLDLNGHQVILWIGETKALVNGQSTKLATPAKTVNGRTMLPLRFVSESLGLEVSWNQETSTIILYRPWFKEELQLDPYNYLDWFSVENDLSYKEPSAPPTNNNSTSSPPSNGSGSTNTTSNEPYDAEGNLIHVSDIVTVGLFDGEVKQISGGKILVYWNSKSYLVPDGDEGFWASLAGIRYMSSTWIEANQVTISSSGY